MKALSLWQPWASLMEMGEKKVETRSWHTSYRGDLVIHAAKKWTEEIANMACLPPFLPALARGGRPVIDYLPRGAFLCVVELYDCVPTVTVRDTLDPDERAFGDYGLYRFAWMTRNVRRFKAPIPGRGYQQLWTPKGDELKSLQEALALVDLKVS